MHNCTKGPPLAEPRAVSQDVVHYFQQREELHALAGRAMIHVQETVAHKYNKPRRMSPNFSKDDRVWARCQRKKILAIRLASIGMGLMRLWPRRLTTSMFFRWTNGGQLMSTLIL